MCDGASLTDDVSILATIGGEASLARLGEISSVYMTLCCVSKLQKTLISYLTTDKLVISLM